MLLYHGTHLQAAKNAIKKGIKSRGNRRNRWKDAPSHEEAVYLTDAYAPYFAISTDKQVGAIIEVDTDYLNPFHLLPDEDALEQTGRGQDFKHLPVPEVGMVERTAWYREHLQDWANGVAWQKSLSALGTCCHMGTIPPEAITQVLIFDTRQAPFTCMMAADPVICTLNYRFCGAQYRALTKWMFKEHIALADRPPEGTDAFWRLPPEEERNTFRYLYQKPQNDLKVAM